MALIDELTARLDAITRERETLKKRAAELDTLEHAVNTVLADARKQQPTPPTQLSMPVTNGNGSAYVGNTENSRFILKALRDSQERTIPELTDMASREGLVFDGKSPGRVLHQTLRGMKFGQYTEKLPDGRWRLTEKGKKGAAHLT